MRSGFKLFSTEILSKKIDISIEHEGGEVYVIGRRNDVRIEEAQKRGEFIEETIERVKDQFERPDED